MEVEEEVWRMAGVQWELRAAGSRLPVEERVGVVLQVEPLHVVGVPQARGRQLRRDDAADDGPPRAG